ncbi:hypothetical protein AUC47_09440 [Microbacterium sp. SZ1]|uniref:Dyp-type peroxidase n=1 Tax=Microbacterium sp. SZ1 TaxID=1849736 RepID=UPI000BBBC519|nr:Dyp-type peroxidase [Microbacterium sp. SZ1]PCE16161.1 hypothetical protein AUC47_09440 [Microbacterium sp. SZ1]
MKHHQHRVEQDRRPQGLSRRALLGSGGAAALGLALSGGGASDVSAAVSGIGTERVDAAGSRQAGIARPRVAQPHLLLAVYDLTGDPAAVLAALGALILELVEGRDRALVGLDPGDLTVTVGAGPRLVAAARKDAPGAEALPTFPREEIDDRHRGGDIVVQVCASDPLLLPLVLLRLAEKTPALRERWRQRGSRGTEERVRRGHSAPRNLLGFVDGIAVPTTKEEFAASVWIPDGPAAGGTVMVVRRMEIDVAAFRSLSVAEQEAAIGRRRASGAPLSGGRIGDDVNLQAKSADGRYLLPIDAHARRAHPRPTGVPLMMRRSYSMDEPLGLLFISMQSELSTFTRTLERMSESDALLAFTRTTASGSFLVLPGFDRDRPLGSSLFGVA